MLLRMKLKAVNIFKPTDIAQQKALFALLEEAVLLLGIDGTVLATNAAMGKLLFLPQKAIEGQNLSLFTTLDAANFSDFLRRFARSAQLSFGALTFVTCKGELATTLKGARMPRANGSKHAFLLLRVIPHLQSQQGFTLLNRKIAQLNYEVTQRQRAEFNLRSQKEWFETTLYSIADGVIITDTHSIITFINSAAESITQWTSSQAIDAPLNSVFAIMGIGSRLSENHNLALSCNAPRQISDTHVLIDKSGQERAIHYTCAPIIVDGIVSGGVVVFRDVSEQHKLHQQLRSKTQKLEEAGRHTSNYLIMLAHELRNPLAPIINALQVMQLSPDMPETNQEMQLVISRQTLHLKRLVDDMLDVSRIHQGKVSVSLDKHKLGDIIKSSIIDFVPQFERLDIALSYTVPSEPIWVKLDAVRMAQVLSNLLVNAKKFTPPGGQVSVNLHSDVNQAYITVQDNGMGIDADLLPVLFEPFTQGKQKLDRTLGGLGLGLALVKGIIELHGGNVSAHSGGSGNGTKLVLSLPLSTAGSTLAPISGPIAQTRKLGSQRVLLIEDNLDNGTTLVALMELLGYQIRWAKNGLQGIAAANEHRPDLIICDIGLPDIDGIEVAARLAKDKHTAKIPIIAMSGYTVKNLEAQMGESLFAEHLLKPTNITDIQIAIEKVLMGCTDRQKSTKLS